MRKIEDKKITLGKEKGEEINEKGKK